MKINFTPQARFDALNASVSGDVLTINGDVFDFGFLAEGEVLPNTALVCPFLSSGVERIAGEITLTLFLPVTKQSSDTAKFNPAPVTITEGIVELPT